MQNKDKKPLVSVIVPTYKRLEKLERCLKSIEANTYKNLEIIVINDNPAEDLSYLKRQYRISLIQHKEEKYWVNCRNEGAKLAKGRLLFFVDDDNILDKNAIKYLVEKYTSLAKVGLLGPIMYKIDKSLWFWGAKVTWINPYPSKLKPPDKHTTLLEADVIPNAYMVSRQLYMDLGMEDPNFQYHEELDLAQRLKLRGYKNFIYTRSKIIHDFGNLKSRVNKFRVYITIKSHIMIERKYASTFRYLLFLLVFLPINTLYYLLYKIPTSDQADKKELYKAYIGGLIDGFRERVKFSSKKINTNR